MARVYDRAVRLGSVRATGEHVSTARPRTGLVVGDEIVDLTDPAIGLPGDMVALLALGSDALGALRHGAGQPGAAVDRRPRSQLTAPVPSSSLVSGHRPQLRRPHRRARARAPRVPDLVLQAADLRDRAGRRRSRSRGCPRRSTTKASSAWSSGGGAGTCPPARALEVVAGFTVVNDVSVRDWQWRTPTMMMGKGFDTHGPTGPWIVTADEVDDPQDLARPHLGQRRAPPGRHHRGHDLHLRPDDRAPVGGVHPRGGDADHHRHAGRRGRRRGPAPVAGGRRHR